MVIARLLVAPPSAAKSHWPAPVAAAALSIEAAVAPSATGVATATGPAVRTGLLGSAVAVVGVSESQVVPRLPAIDVPAMVGAPAETATWEAAASPTASLTYQAPTAAWTVWLTPDSVPVNAVIVGASSDSEPAVRVPVALVVSACAAIGASANADAAASPIAARVSLNVENVYMELPPKNYEQNFLNEWIVNESVGYLSRPCVTSVGSPTHSGGVPWLCEPASRRGCPCY